MNTLAATGQARMLPMHEHDLEAVLAIEHSAYSHPWRRGHFLDALAQGYWAQCLWLEGRLLGYVVAMAGVQETHLLNITVAPEQQAQGWARHMLDGLCLWSRAQAAQWLWLEVRQSNARALHVYERYGFRQVSVRKDYYRADRQQREHAVVMSLNLKLQPTSTPAPTPTSTHD